MKKNTQPKIKPHSTSKTTDLETNSTPPILSLVPSLETSLSPPSPNNTLPSHTTLKNSKLSLNHVSSLKSSKTKLKLAVPPEPNHSKELHVMATKDPRKPSDTTQNISNGANSPSNVDLKFPDMIDFYRGWMSFYEHQWELFFKSWSYFLGHPNFSSSLFAEQSKEFQQYYTSLANQFQECTSIAQRTTQDTLQMMHESSHQTSVNSDKSTKNNGKAS